MTRQLNRQASGRRALVTAAMLALSVFLMAPAPAHADHNPTANVGGGVVSGSVVLDPGSYIPAADEPCKDGNTFTLGETTAAAVALNTVFTGYVGDVDDLEVTGRGAANTCESVTGSSGVLWLSAEGTGPTGSHLKCLAPNSTASNGTFTRVGNQVTVEASMNCTINTYGAGKVSFISQLVVETDPNTFGERVYAGAFKGPFTISPVLD